MYDKFVALLSTTSPYKLSKTEKAVIDEALDESKFGQGYTREEVMKEALQKYPDLNFRWEKFIGIYLHALTISKTLITYYANGRKKMPKNLLMKLMTSILY